MEEFAFSICGTLSSLTQNLEPSCMNYSTSQVPDAFGKLRPTTMVFSKDLPFSTVVGTQKYLSFIFCLSDAYHCEILLLMKKTRRQTKKAKNKNLSHVHSEYLRFLLRLSLRVNGRITIRLFSRNLVKWPNGNSVTIHFLTTENARSPTKEKRKLDQ